MVSHLLLGAEQVCGTGFLTTKAEGLLDKTSKTQSCFILSQLLVASFCFFLSDADGFEFQLNFKCVQVLALIFSGLIALHEPLSGERGWERIHRLASSSPALIPPTSIPATSNLTEESYKLQMHSKGTCVGAGQRNRSFPVE